MFKLDNDFLISLGLGGLPVDEKNRLLQVIYERLEMNVGMRLAEKMTDQQLDEFEGFIDRNDEAGALRWLETNFPNYKDVVAEELEKLKKEVGASAPQIMAAAQAAAPAGAPQAPPAAPTGQVQPSTSQPFGQPAQAPQPGTYNPENPFQSHNPEFQNVAPAQPGQPTWQQPTSQPSAQPGYQMPPSPAPQPQPAAPQPYAQPQPQPTAPYQPAPPSFMPPQPQQSASQSPQSQQTWPPATPQQPPAGPQTPPSSQPPAGPQQSGQPLSPQQG